MLRPTNKGPYLSNFGQVRSVQASDRTATDDADSFDQIAPAGSRLCAGTRILRLGPSKQIRQKLARASAAKNRISGIVRIIDDHAR